MTSASRPRPFGILVFGGLCAWGAWETQHWLHSDDLIIPLVFAAMAGLSGIQLLVIMLGLIPSLVARAMIKHPSQRAGSAGWAHRREIRREKLYRHDGFFIGVDAKGKPVFADIESSGLVLDPAGGGKTTGFVIPALCHCPHSMLVPDLKSTLAPMTAALRTKHHGQETICINPSGKYIDVVGETKRYNPLQVLIDAWADPALHSFLFANAQGLARQLCPDPPTQSENQYFRNGSRKMIVFASLYLVITGANPNLSTALAMLSEPKQLKRMVQAGARMSELEGDLARLGKDLLAKLEAGDQKQVESFREGAVQALEPYAPSGVLAACTAFSDFRFADLRTKKLTIYLMGDPTRKAAFDPWLGLMSWCAMTELVRSPPVKPVVMLCEEVTNMKLEGLPSFLTLAREFRIKIWLIMQELEEWSKVYGRESLETLLSQTEVQVMSTRSYKASQLISNMLGEETVKTRSHNLGASILDAPSASMSEAARRVHTADEVRRSNELIVFIRKMRPLHLQRLGYHEIKPWQSWVGINPLHGKTYKGRVKLHL